MNSIYSIAIFCYVIFSTNILEKKIAMMQEIVKFLRLINNQRHFISH